MVLAIRVFSRFHNKLRVVAGVDAKGGRGVGPEPDNAGWSREGKVILNGSHTINVRFGADCIVGIVVLGELFKVQLRDIAGTGMPIHQRQTIVGLTRSQHGYSVALVVVFTSQTKNSVSSVIDQ